METGKLTRPVSTLITQRITKVGTQFNVRAFDELFKEHVNQYLSPYKIRLNFKTKFHIKTNGTNKNTAQSLHIKKC